jgi:hypothetical protein
LELKRHTRARDAYVQREGCIVYSNSWRCACSLARLRLIS